LERKLANKSRVTGQKKAKEQKRREKAQRKKEQKEIRKLEKGTEEEEELKPLSGPVYFTDFEDEDIRI